MENNPEQIDNDIDLLANDLIDDMPRLYTVAEVADYLHVSRSTVYRLIREGVLCGIRVGQSLRFTKENLSELIETSTVVNGL